MHAFTVPKKMAKKIYAKAKALILARFRALTPVELIRLSKHV